MAQNLFEELKEVLAEFKQFLDDNIDTIRPAIQAIAGLIPQVNELIDKLIDLMGKLKTEIQNLDLGSVAGVLGDAVEFTSRVTAFLEAAKSLLPDEADEIDEVLGIAEVVAGLPSFDAVKTEIIALVDAIVVHLNSLKA